jgi:hypothetical protein
MTSSRTYGLLSILASDAISRQLLPTLSLPHLQKTLGVMRAEDFEQARQDCTLLTDATRLVYHAARSGLPPALAKRLPKVTRGFAVQRAFAVVTLATLFDMKREDAGANALLLSLARYIRDSLASCEDDHSRAAALAGFLGQAIDFVHNHP